MFFPEIYGSWRKIQREKYEHTFRVLGSEFLGRLEGRRVLNVGSGSGFLEEFLIEKGMKAKITGIDIRFAKTGFPFILGDANEMPFKDNIFHAIFCIDTIHLVQINEFSRILKKKGLVLAAIFFNEENYYERKEMMRQRLADFETLLEFEIDGKEKEYVVLARKL